MGGTHGKNRLGGNSLLDCVVFGRESGKNVSKYLFENCLNYLSKDEKYKSSLGTIANHLKSNNNKTENKTTTTTTTTQPQKGGDYKSNLIPLEEVQKHNTEKDCWVIVNNEVLNVTNFLKDHPGGASAIIAYGGKDATENFNLFHPKDTVEEYAPEVRDRKSVV